VLEVVTPTTSS